MIIDARGGFVNAFVLHYIQNQGEIVARSCILINIMSVLNLLHSSNQMARDGFPF